MLLAFHAFQDGATHLKYPLMNVLASGVHNNNALLEIVDCSGHVAKGNKKCAVFIANCFIPHLERLDPEKNSVDMIAFDGASNMTKGAQLLATDYPRITAIHGAEHVISLFCKDVCSLKEVKLLTDINRRLRNIFVSVRHAPTAMFKKQSKLMNGGLPLGFVKPCDVRMGGKIIALLRLLRLRHPLVGTLVLKEFRDLKICPQFCTVLQVDELWTAIFTFCRAMYAVMRALRLADMKVPAMDKVRVYCRV